MPATNAHFVSSAEAYFDDLRKIRASGGATPERSFYPAIINLLNSVGDSLSPKVFCISEMAEQGAGHPDIGLYAASQVRSGQPRDGQLPERGVVEVKSADEDVRLTAASDQASRYWDKYRVVLVTNTREFILIGETTNRRSENLEAFRVAESAEEFETRLENPRALAQEVGVRLGEYLMRALSHQTAIVEPKDLAWLLASYARDGLERVKLSDDTQSLRAVREGLEAALGIRFKGDKGTTFFQSTLVQTLFYGVFSAWVLWARQNPSPTSRFNWRESGWHLRVPVLRELFQQLSDPGRLLSLGLVEVLDWTAVALDRVNRETFFTKFRDGEAVPYFYEPFLEEFDPALRKELGVWYTPAEVVRYMVAQVDRTLKDDLGIDDGLAADQVIVLDPCCGTGAYLSEVLRRVEASLQEKGMGALTGEMVKRAATSRIFGFEIMPAPFVVAHLQVGLTMQELGAALSDDGSERPGVFLTNALTGWEPRPQTAIPFPDLEEERDLADRVKREDPVLVILGNPPYNGFAGVAVDEESELIDAYRNPERVEITNDRGLNDLYVRFFRMAERRIIDGTGHGVVCFISNYSWLHGLSHAGMRERYLNAFDVIRIDNLHGDRKISEDAPDGRTSETVFRVSGRSPGIKIGTAITLLAKSQGSSGSGGTDRILYRDFEQAKAEERRSALIDSLTEDGINDGYTEVEPDLRLGLPFRPMPANDNWFDWPELPDIFSVSFPGVHTGRDRFLVDADLDRLKARVAEYFDPELSHEEINRRYPAAMRSSTAFRPKNARTVRSAMQQRGAPNESGFVRDAYRPFDNRWLYWENDRGLLTAPSPGIWPHLFEGNLWLSSAKQLRKSEAKPQACFTKHAGSFHLIERGAVMFPAWLSDDGLTADGFGRRANLTHEAQQYLNRLGLSVDDLFHHVLATLHNPSYLESNSGGLRMGWPRIPMPGWPQGEEHGAADEMLASANRGRQLVALLNVDEPVEGIATGTPLTAISLIAVPTTVHGNNMAENDFKVTANWGYSGARDAVNMGTGRVNNRPFNATERTAMGDAIAVWGSTTLDIYMNDTAYWKNVPTAVWNYNLGGYQVLKKWLSYREHKVSERILTFEEVEHFTHTARRIAAILQVCDGFQ